MHSRHRFGFEASCLVFVTLALTLTSCDAWTSASSDPSCDGSTVVVELSMTSLSSTSSKLFSSSTSTTKKKEYALPSPFGPPFPLPANSTSAKPLRLVVADPIDACTKASDGSMDEIAWDEPFALLVARGGGCSFLEKVRNAKALNASAVVVFNADSRGCIALGIAGNSSVLPEELEKMPTTVSVDAATGARLLAAPAKESILRIFDPTLSTNGSLLSLVDASSYVLAVLAVSGIVIGALLASRDEVKRRTRRSVEREHELEGEDEPLPFSTLVDVAFVVGAMAGALLAAYFFPKIFSLLLTLLFMFGSFQTTSVVATKAIAKVFPLTKKKISLEPIHGLFLKRTVVADAAEETETLTPQQQHQKRETTLSCLAGTFFVALPAAALWLSCGPRRIWPLHDLLALSLISSIPVGLRVPSFRACVALLSLAAFNDVFFVMIQPRITHGESVMVSVATKTPALVLLSPLQRGGPMAGFALLGFGDVVIPGCCVAFAGRWDSLQRLRRRGIHSSSSTFPTTFASSVLGYLSGLSLTYFALYHRFGSDYGQPALLYLSPSVLLATAAAVALRGGQRELREAWRGLDDDDDDACRRRSTQGATAEEAEAPLVA